MQMLGQKSSTAAAVVVVVAAIGVDVLLSACGGSAPTRPTPIPIVLTVVISSNGLSPAITLAPAEVNDFVVQLPDELFVRFNNTDTVAHDIRSDPHPDHTDCPALNIETVAAGQSVVTPILNQCLRGTTQQSYHDETRPDDARFQGRIGRRR